MRSPAAGRTLWLMGDSQTWHLYYAAECFLRDHTADWVRRSPSADPAVMAAMSPVIDTASQTPVVPMCIHLRKGTRVCMVRSRSVRGLPKPSIHSPHHPVLSSPSCTAGGSTCSRGPQAEGCSTSGTAGSRLRQCVALPVTIAMRTESEHRRRLKMSLYIDSLSSKPSPAAAQVRMHKGPEAVGALTALLDSEEAADLSQDLLVLNFGLHYNGRNLTGQLEDDLRELRSFIVSHKVSRHIALVGIPYLRGLLLHGFPSLQQLCSSDVCAGLLVLPLSNFGQQPATSAVTG